eukprot:TRINITY_DN47662_c0_g1_i1.p1 TRINITY_DN47662_c0_g1~~TRINITY_DN47662_c0_g1_i1.p1  ORF type:complete len:581 (-),score=103.49 TRINITY_DN47662_c0_g1_i1:4-1689(-)
MARRPDHPVCDGDASPKYDAEELDAESVCRKDLRNHLRHSLVEFLDRQEHSKHAALAVLEGLDAAEACCDILENDCHTYRVQLRACSRRYTASQLQLESEIDEIGTAPKIALQPTEFEDEPHLQDHLFEVVPEVETSWKASAEGPKTKVEKLITELRRISIYENEAFLDGGLYQYLKRQCMLLLDSHAFGFIMGLVVLVDSVSMGIEAQWSLQPEWDRRWPLALDIAFTCIYSTEIIIHLVGWRRSTFTDPWFWFALALVLIGIASMVPPFRAGSQEPAQILDRILVVRTFRLLRPLRALRMMKHFRTLWRLVYGLLTSGNTMLSTLSLIALVLYVFACVSVEVITKDEELATHPDTAQIVADNFDSLAMTLLTFSQFVSMDSCADIYKPLVKKRPSLIVFFLSIILLVYLALMNLVTAVLVEGALANTQADKELLKQEQYAKLKTALGTLENLFSEMDADGDGSLTLAEIERVPIDVIPQECLDNSSVGSMVEVFQILDVDGVGELSKKDFVEGLMNLLMQDVPVETVQTLRLVRSMEGTMKDIAMAVVSNRNGGAFRDV